MDFRITGLSPQPFQSLFALSDAALAEIGVQRCFADAPNSYPCRVSIADAEPGEELILLSWEHQPAHSPYRAAGPIFVRRSAHCAFVATNVIPDPVRVRLTLPCHGNCISSVLFEIISWLNAPFVKRLLDRRSTSPSLMMLGPNRARSLAINSLPAPFAPQRKAGGSRVDCVTRSHGRRFFTSPSGRARCLSQTRNNGAIQ